MLWAFLDNQDLWYELLTPVLDLETVDEVPDWFTRCIDDELDFQECMGLLLRHSFIDVKTEASAFSMHSVLHRWCFYAFEGEKVDMSWLAAMVVASAVPSESTPHYTLIQRRLLPHCDQVFSLLRKWAQETPSDLADLRSRSDACHKLANLFSDQGRTKEAEEMYMRALAGYEKAWGAEHTLTLRAVNNLGNLYSNQGRMKETEEMYMRALAGKEKVWGHEYKQPLDVRYNLAVMYKKTSKLEEAAKHFKLVVEGYTKVLGAQHFETTEAFDQLEELRKLIGNEKMSIATCVEAV